jgi:hypothetical protein
MNCSVFAGRADVDCSCCVVVVVVLVVVGVLVVVLVVVVVVVVVEFVVVARNVVSDPLLGSEPQSESHEKMALLTPPEIMLPRAAAKAGAPTEVTL